MENKHVFYSLPSTDVSLVILVKVVKISEFTQQVIQYYVPHQQALCPESVDMSCFNASAFKNALLRMHITLLRMKYVYIEFHTHIY